MAKKTDRTEFIVETKIGKTYCLIYQNQGNWGRSKEVCSYTLDHKLFLNDYVQLELNIEGLPTSTSGKVIALRRSMATEDKHGIWSVKYGRVIGDFMGLVDKVDGIYCV